MTETKIVVQEQFSPARPFATWEEAASYYRLTPTPTPTFPLTVTHPGRGTTLTVTREMVDPNAIDA